MARWIRRIAVLLLVLILVAGATVWWLLRGSLPTLDGELALPGLSAPVSVQRDALGVVTIEAGNEADAMRALGYVHAQERFFEMDLLRRTAAGELSELFGPRALDIDQENRVHRFRARVNQHLATLGAERAVAETYVEGVNAGLAGLKVRPWPYLLLRAQPKPWQLADSPLVGYAMYFDLQDASNGREHALWKIKPHLPPALYALLTHSGSSWDAPLMGEPRGDAMLPTIEQVDLRQLPVPPKPRDGEGTSPRVIGSNNFAVARSLTRDGRAILADDTHLGLRAPNLWFRAQLRFADARAPGGRVDAGGFTLPGLPGMVIGSNGHVAWGYTNGYADTLDWAAVQLCNDDAANVDCVRTQRYREVIAVAGAEPVSMDVEETPWGPVLHRDAQGRALALRWVAHLPGAINLGVLDMMRTSNVAQALQMVDHAALPVQNLLLADRDGAIAWRLIGPLPQREAACDPTAPVTLAAPSAAGCHPWTISTAASPSIIAPPNGRLWTANNRVADGEALQRIGDGGYALGARAQQIRNDLFAKPQFNERDLLAIQLDDRAVFLQRWWQLLQDSAKHSGTPALRELAAAGSTWDGRASTDSVSYRLVRAWRMKVNDRIVDGLTAPARAALGEDFVMPGLQQQEGFVWPLLTQRPAHLLSRRFSSWDALLEDAAVAVRTDLKTEGPLAQRTWGERNTAAICHPLAGALPKFAKGVLCMPFEPLPGDTSMPRVQQPDFGASQRMVVSPGHEADGIIHMPGGQSGNPLSPFWGAGHDDWVHGRPTAFLPGKAQYTLRMKPAR